MKNLDLDYVLKGLKVYSPYGELEKKNMNMYLPLQSSLLDKEYDNIGKIIEHLNKNKREFLELQDDLKYIKNLNSTFSRLNEAKVISTLELFEIKIMINKMKGIKLILEKVSWEFEEELMLKDLDDAIGLLDPDNRGINTFYIYDSYSLEIKRIREKIKNLGLDIKRKEIKASADLALNLKIEEEEEEYRIRENLSKSILKYLEIIRHNVGAIGKIDLLLSKALYALETNSIRPIIKDEDSIKILSGRNLKVEGNLKEEKKEFTPVSIEIERGVTCITGANMGGKTVSLKTVGLLVAMAQYGLFVPAKEFEYSPRDYIFVSVGDFQSVDRGLSTFGGEIENISSAIERVDERGLILIDELARGTNPAEGYAISKALVNFLGEKKTITVLTTHFDHIADDPKINHYQVVGLAYEDKDKMKKLIDVHGLDLLYQLMDYRLKKINSYKEVPKEAINIASIMGLPKEILEDAKGIIGGPENEK